MYQAAEVEHMEVQKKQEGNHETLFAQLHIELRSLPLVFRLHVMLRVPGYLRPNLEISVWALRD